MVLTNKQKAVIENDFNEKAWNAYKIWKEHPSFEFSRMAIHNLIKKTRLTERHKKVADPLPQKQKKMRRFLRSFLVRKKMDLVPTVPSGKSHLG